MTTATHGGESGELQLIQDQGAKLNQKRLLRCDALPPSPPKQEEDQRRAIFLLLKSIVLQLGGVLILNMGMVRDERSGSRNVERISHAIADLESRLRSMPECGGPWRRAGELADIVEQLGLAVAERWSDAATLKPEVKAAADNEARMLSLMWQLMEKARVVDSSLRTVLVNLDAACCNGVAQ